MSTAVASQDLDAIKKVILEYYQEGGRAADNSVLKKAFHPASTMYGYNQKEMTGGPIDILWELVDKVIGPAKNLRIDMTHVDIVGGQIAQVRTEDYDWAGTRYTDMFNLIKENGEWKIISKIYYVWS